MLNRLFSTAESFDYVKKWEKNIAWDYLCMNPNNWAIDYMKQNINKIDWHTICKNPNPRIIREIIEPFLATRKLEIDFSELCRRHYAVNFFKTNPHLIDIYSFIENPNPEAIAVIDHYLEYNKYDIPIEIVQNPNAMHHVYYFYDVIDTLSYDIEDLFWYYLSANAHSDAVSISLEHMDKINIELFSRNEGIVAINDWTEEMVYQICWNSLVFNPEFPKIIRKIQKTQGRENVKQWLFDNVDYETLSTVSSFMDIVVQIQQIYPELYM